MRSIQYVYLFGGCVLFIQIAAIQVHETTSEEATSPAAPILYDAYDASNASASEEIPTISIAPSVTPSTVFISTTTYSNENGSFVQTSKNIVSVSTDANPLTELNQKRQLHPRHGSYVIGSSENLKKSIEQRESKEITLNRGEHMKNDFKPSPEVRITSPQYHPSLSSYADPGVVSGRFTPPNVHSSTVKFQDSGDDRFKWHTPSPTLSTGRGSFTSHSTNSAHTQKTKLRTEYPKFEAIVKDTQQQKYQKQLFHRHHSENLVRGLDGSTIDNGQNVIWTSSRGHHHHPEQLVNIETTREKFIENEQNSHPPPTFSSPSFDSHLSHHSQSLGDFGTPESTFSPESGSVAPTFGYPGIDTDNDIILRTSDRPDAHDYHEYDIIKGNEHVKAPPHHNAHHKHHIDHHHLWKGAFKVLAAAVPLGLLFSALTPNVVFVNANSTSPPPPNIPIFPNRPGFAPNRPLLPPSAQLPINPRPGTLFAGRLRNAGGKHANFVSDLMKEINVGHIDPGRAPQMTAVCEDRFYCELGRLGTRPQSDKETAEYLHKMLWKIAMEIPNFQDRQPSQDVFEAMSRNECTAYNCKEYEHFQEVNHFEVKEWRS